MLNLEPIKARLAAATPGNWCWDYDQAERAVVDPGWLIYSKNAPKQTLLGKINNYEDMELVVNAPDDLAALFVEVERLRSEMEEIDSLRAELAHTKNEMRRYIRKSEVLEAQIAGYEKALEWYAAPSHWVEQVDDRGRDTLRWRWADDDGRMARHALNSWKQNKKEKANGANQGGAQEAGGQGDQADAGVVAPPGGREAGETVRAVGPRGLRGHPPVD